MIDRYASAERQTRGHCDAEISRLGQERDQAIIRLATALNRHRSLTDEESIVLEAAIRREQRIHGLMRDFWTKAQDRALGRHLDRGRKVREIAPLMNKTEAAIWSRIRELRKRQRAEQGLVAAVAVSVVR